MTLDEIQALCDAATQPPDRTWASLSLAEQIALTEAKAKLQEKARTLMPRLVAVARAVKAESRGRSCAHDWSTPCAACLVAALEAP